ncbi:FkbM family methyltransferase [Rhizobium sp. F40D2]|uniref:FkbM family methyltransferase n=1 Tax=Rhizobium sp. F40D2 TaxID=3453141 RepID=UPI003F20CFD6
MIKLAFITQHTSWPWRRQLPQRQASFDGVEFFVATTDADFVVVYDALPSGSQPVPAGAKTIFVASEPPSVKRYNPDFLGQFDFVITPDRQTPHPNRIFTQAGLPWHVGTMSAGGALLDKPMSFEDFRTYNPVKTKLVSVVSSNKDFTEEHRARLAFVAKLKEAFGDQIDIFGRGIVDFADKRDVLDEYRYHISLENCAIPDYWTEKLADPYLTLTFPIYYGCTNVLDYFSEGSLRQINIEEPNEAIAAIRDIIESDLAERSRDELLEARRRVMHEQNLFGVLARIARQHTSDPGGQVPKNSKTLRAESRFASTPLKRLKFQIIRQLEKSPTLKKIPGGIRARRAKFLRRFNHFWRLATDDTYRAHQNWITSFPEDQIRYEYPLRFNANVLDVGGYLGDFAAEFVNRYNAQVAIFEPVPRFAEQVENRFAGEPKIIVFRAGLSDQDMQVEFELDADASGQFQSSGKRKIQVDLWDAARYFRESPVTDWDLMKLNIEGGEYSLLERLIETGHISAIRYLQVQFHLHVPNARRRYRKLARQLRRTHRLDWRYPFVWESWTRREKAGAPE